MAQKIYYKVVRVYDKKLLSANEPITKNYTRKLLIVEYKKNKWTRPKKNGNPFLFVFNSLSAAKNWMEAFGNDEIYKCKIGKLIPYIVADNNLYKRKHKTIGYTPNGAKLTDKIMITKKVC